jgi:hypothetical protein
MSVALFYENPRPLDANRDAGLRVREITDLGFARGTNTIPVNLAEFSPAARCYPIGFVGEAALPAVIVGLQDRNVFVGADGRWKARAYVPAFVRRYPFIFAETDTADQFTLCIDDTPRAIAEAGQGRALFENGQPSGLTSQALEFCQAFHAGAKATDAFVKALLKADILVDRKAETRLALGASFALTGFKCVDPERLRRVPGRILAAWNEKGWLAPIFVHLQSMTNWNDVMELIPEVLASKMS